MPATTYLDRIVIAQSILDAVGRETYLEIGVDTGGSFIPIKAKRKWGIDPSYKLTGRRLSKYAVFSFLRIKVERLFRMTSDEFFAENEKLLTSYGIDVCLVDGLHTYEQALKDVLNALKYLKPKGVILLHDCSPTTELMARPAAGIEDLIRQRIPQWDGFWSGDVWKTVVHLRALQDDVDAFVLDCDTGIGIVTKRRPRSYLSFSENDIRAMDYNFLSNNRQGLLGLQPTEYFKDFLHWHTTSR
jgi:SAM-dependent methyltransferase